MTVNINVCLSDIPAEARKQADNGKWYANLVLQSRQTPGKFGETHSLSIQQTKEEREAKAARVYVGSGKEFKIEKLCY